MFNTKKVHNVEQFRAYRPDEVIRYKAQPGTGVVTGEIELNTVGPCVARVRLPDVGKKVGPIYLLGVFEGHETIQFAIAADEVGVVLEPSAEVWYRRQKVAATAENPNPDVTFTRMEKMGLEQDELGIALHRQAILNRIEGDRRQQQADSYTRKLEKRLEETNAAVDRLTKASEAAAEAKAQAAAELAAAE